MEYELDVDVLLLGTIQTNEGYRRSPYWQTTAHELRAADIANAVRII